MIKLELSQAVFLYLLFTVIGIFILWIFFDEKNKLPLLDEDESCVWKCDICTHTYIDSVNSDISKCPLCGSLNERISCRENRSSLINEQKGGDRNGRKPDKGRVNADNSALKGIAISYHK